MANSSQKPKKPKMANSSQKPKKPSKLSRLIASMQSPKRGSSLVVETGFPTSLIDLFVKNRERLKQKKKTQMKISKPALFEKSVIEGETLRQCDGEVIGGIKAVEMLKKDVTVFDSDNEDENEYDDVFVKSVCVMFLKMFVVVVLALSTRWLVVGIALSFFLLACFECVGRGFKGLFRVRKDRNSSVELSRVKEEPIPDYSEGSGLVGIVEDDCSSGELIKEDGADFCKDKKKGKKFIKKIVMKFKTMKAKKKNKKKGKETETEAEAEPEVKSDELFSCKYEFIEEKVDGEGGFSVQESEILSSGELCKADVELSNSKKNVGNGRKVNSGYLVLVFVVLGGLFGGRMMASAITIAWFVTLKFVCKLRGRVGQHVSRSYVPNSS